MQKNFKKTYLVFGALVICFSIAFYIVAWQEPSQTAPDSNVAAPVNTGSQPQAKAGRITATEFYDYNDSNYYLNPSGESKVDSFKDKIKINEGATYFDALEICNFGTCCPPWKDCDLDYTAYAGTPLPQTLASGYVITADSIKSFNPRGLRDCDEGNTSIFEKSLNGTASPDGKDNDCDGAVDELDQKYYISLKSLYGTGNLGGRSGADSWCGGGGNGEGAFISVNADDEIRDFLTTKGINPNYEWWWIKQSTPLDTEVAKIANNWADLLDGSILNDSRAVGYSYYYEGEGPYGYSYLTGSNSDGSVRNTCSGWTSDSGTASYGQGGVLGSGWLKQGDSGFCTFNSYWRFPCFFTIGYQ